MTAGVENIMPGGEEMSYREYILEFLKEQGKYCTFAQIETYVKKKHPLYQENFFREELRQLLEDGYITRVKEEDTYVYAAVELEEAP